MPRNEIGNLTLKIEPEALRAIIAEGRLLEFVDNAARAQIAAQIVDQLAQASLEPAGAQGGVAVDFALLFEGGDYGTKPHWPHFGVTQLGEAEAGALSRVAGAASRAG